MNEAPRWLYHAERSISQAGKPEMREPLSSHLQIHVFPHPILRSPSYDYPIMVAEYSGADYSNEESQKVTNVIWGLQTI